MERAFRYAQEADPSTLAFYNDYNVLFKNKQDKIVSMIQAEEEAREKKRLMSSLNMDIEIKQLNLDIQKSPANKHSN